MLKIILNVTVIFNNYLKCFICYQPVSALGFPSEVLPTSELQPSPLRLSKKSCEAFINSVCPQTTGPNTVDGGLKGQGQVKKVRPILSSIIVGTKFLSIFHCIIFGRVLMLVTFSHKIQLHIFSCFMFVYDEQLIGTEISQRDYTMELLFKWFISLLK